jgi:hypothetical protein
MRSEGHLHIRQLPIARKFAHFFSGSEGESGALA